MGQFYAQAQGPAGNFTDILGASQNECESHAKWYAQEFSVSTQVIERVDTVVRKFIVVKEVQS